MDYVVVVQVVTLVVLVITPVINPAAKKVKK
jgi:hypothetical protein